MSEDLETFKEVARQILRGPCFERDEDEDEYEYTAANGAKADCRHDVCLEKRIAFSYQMFVNRLLSGRGMSTEENRRMFDALKREKS